MSALIGVFSHSFGSVIPCGFAFLLFFYRPLHTFSGGTRKHFGNLGRVLGMESS